MKFKNKFDEYKNSINSVLNQITENQISQSIDIIRKTKKK